MNIHKTSLFTHWWRRWQFQLVMLVLGIWLVIQLYDYFFPPVVPPLPIADRYITVEGDLDPRLQARVLSWFRSTDFNDDCTRKDWNTGSRKTSLTVRGEVGLTGKFKVRVPLDFAGKSRCGWEYVDSEITFARFQDKKPTSYTRLTLVSSRQKGHHTEIGFASGGAGRTGLIPAYGTTNKKYYFLNTQLDMKCFTRQYISTGNTRFQCTPQEKWQWNNGVDSLDNLHVQVRAVVDESQQPFMEFVPPPSWYVALWRSLNQSLQQVWQTLRPNTQGE